MLTYIFFISTIYILSFIDNIILIYHKSIKSRYKKNGLYKVDKLILEPLSYKKFSIIYKITLLFIFCFMAFRFEVGWDYKAYFNTIKYNIKTNIIGNGEYINIFLIELSRKFNITNLYFFANSFILLFFVFITVKNYSDDYWVSLLFFICFPLFFLNSLSVIRTFSALAISFYGIKFIEQKKFINYLLVVIIASMFHKSSVITIVFYFLKNIKLNNVKLFFLLLSVPFVSNYINYTIFRFFPKYAFYVNITSKQEGTKAILVLVFIWFVITIFKNNIIDNNYLNNIYYNIYTFGVYIYIMFYSQGTMGHRLSLYGTIYSLLLLPKVINIFNHKNKFFIKIYFYSFCLLFFFFTIYIGKETYIPYKTIWSEY